MKRTLALWLSLLLSSALLVPAAPALAASDSDCKIVGTKNSEVLTGTERRDVICAGAGNDTIYALGGDDVIRGGSGNDIANA